MMNDGCKAEAVLKTKQEFISLQSYVFIHQFRMEHISIPMDSSSSLSV